MLTLAVIRTPERVVDHFSAVHRYGDAMRPAATWFGQGAAVKGQCYPIDPACLLPLLAGRIDETTLLGRGKAPPRPVSATADDASASATSIRAAEC